MLTCRSVCCPQAELGQNLGQAFLTSVGYDNAPHWRGLVVLLLFAFMVAVNVATVLSFRFLDGGQSLNRSPNSKAFAQCHLTYPFSSV